MRPDRARLVGGRDRHSGDAPDGLGLDAHREAAERDEHDPGEPARDAAAVDLARDDRDDHEQDELDDDERRPSTARPETVPEHESRRGSDRESGDGERAPPPRGRAVATDRHPEERDIAALIRGEHAEEPVEADRVDEAGDGRQHRRHDERRRRQARRRWLRGVRASGHGASAWHSHAAESGRRAILLASRGRGSAGRASPCQGEGRGFESRRPLQDRI